MTLQCLLYRPTLSHHPVGTKVHAPTPVNRPKRCYFHNCVCANKQVDTGADAAIAASERVRPFIMSKGALQWQATLINNIS